MPARSSPTVKRRRLAAELRRLRELTKLTIEDVAERLEWSAAKISRIENARVTVLPRDVKFLIAIYGLTPADPAWDALLALSRESRQRGWWQQYGDAIPEWFGTFVGLEAEAEAIWSYDPEYVPGLLQTEDYARTVHRAQLIDGRDEDIDRLVRVRMARQELLTAEDAPQVWLVINEAVLRRLVGGADVMRAQLRRLAQAATLPKVTIQVVPFSAGAHPAMDGGFILLSFPSDPNIVYIEYHAGSLYLENQADVGTYSLKFDHLRATALSADASQALMARILREMG
jgi:transcriptional regulator with XRE-family HTH domain